jgi:hypothetical protein
MGHTLDELGDFLWTTCANGLNAGIALEQALRHELSPDQLGDGSITVAQIDKLALELVAEEPLDVMAEWIAYLGSYLGRASKQWRNLGPLIDPEAQPQGFSDAWILMKRNRTYDGLTQAVLATSVCAQRFAGASLSDVMDHNAAKLRARKLSGKPLTTPVEPHKLKVTYQQD